jgi:hypothetical protein
LAIEHLGGALKDQAGREPTRFPQKLLLSAQFGFLNVGFAQNSGHRISAYFNVVKGSSRPIAVIELLSILSIIVNLLAKTC